MKKRQLYDKRTKEDFVPVAHTEATMTPDGESAEARNARQQLAVKGSGPDASANIFPMLNLGDFASLAAANTELDKVFHTTLWKFQGHLRLSVQGQVLFIDQFAVDQSRGYWLQVAKGQYMPSNDGLSLVQENSKYHVSYRFRNNAVNTGWRDVLTTGLSLKTINGQSIIGEGNIVVQGGGSSVIIDPSLDPTSQHAVANAPVATAIAALQQAIANINPSDSSVIMCEYWAQLLPNIGEEGAHAYDMTQKKIFVRQNGQWVEVEPNGDAIYVRKPLNMLYRWSGEDMQSLMVTLAPDAALSANSTNSVQNKVVYAAIQNLITGLQITEREIQDLRDAIASSSSEGKTKIIRVWGDDYQVTENWLLGDLWFDEAGGTLKVITNEEQVEFSDTEFVQSCLYYAAQRKILYIYDGRLIPIFESQGGDEEHCYTIRVWGEDPQASSAWKIGDLWYNDDIDELKRCVDVGTNLNFEDAVFEPNAFYRRADTSQWYVWDENEALVEITNRDVDSRAATNTTLIGRLQVQLQALTARVEALEQGEPTPEPTPEITPFNPLEGNAGVISINKAPENITVADVRGALTLPSLIGQGQSLTTAAEAGLQEGTTNAIMDANTQILKTLASADNPCVGLKLDKVYYARITKNSHYNYASGSAVKLEKDFTIDGEVNGEAVGGLVTDGSLFYTQNSLTLNKARFSSTSTHSDAMFYIDTTPGVEQLDVKGCVFTSASSGANYFQFGSNVNLSPLDGNGFATDDNCINHINVDSCQAEGHLFMQSSGLRVVKSWRITNNTFTGIKGAGMSIGVNSGTYVGYMAYMSCPMFVAGNTFQGRQGIQRNRKSGGYYCGLLAETASVYMLHNTIRDFVSGHSEYINSSGTTKKYHAWTYEAYFNTTQVYFCNNTVTNIMRFDTYRLDVCCLKSKGSCVPAEYNNGHMDILRYYKDNTFNTDAKPMQWWADRASSYVADGNDYTPEINADNALDAQKFVAVVLNWASTFNIIGQQFLFDGNIVEANSIGGGSTGSHLWAEEAVVTNNEFRADNIISEGFSLFESVSQEVLFSFRGNEIEMAGNTFTALNSVIRAILLKYYTSQGDTGPATVSMHDNIVPNSSSLRAWNAW